MFLNQPAPTQFDLNFQIFGIPVRVSPWFWLGCLITGSSGLEGSRIVIWFSAMFVSILVHELGHSFMMLRFGRRSHIVLTAFGGLAIEGDADFRSVGTYSRQSARTPLEQTLISFAGPGAGFLFALLLFLGIVISGGRVRFDMMDFPFFWRFALPGDPREIIYLYDLIESLLFINVFWGLMNLLPILPLDGGQIALQFFIVNDPWGGVAKAHWVGVFVGGAMAIYGLSHGGSFMVMLFASLAFSNYMALQQYHGGRRDRW